MAYHWKKEDRADLVHGHRHGPDRARDVPDRGAQPLGGGRISARSSSEGLISLTPHMAPNTVIRMTTVPMEARVHPVGHAVVGLADDDLLQDEQRQVGRHRARTRVEALGEEPAGEPTASQSTPTKGKKNRTIAHRIAPLVMKALRRPHRSLHTLSPTAPIKGWMNRPVIGPAMFSIGSCSGLAPINVNNGFTADWVRPKLNDTPKNPSVMISMLLPLSRGLRSPASCGITVVVVVSLSSPRQLPALEVISATFRLRGYRCGIE